MLIEQRYRTPQSSARGPALLATVGAAGAASIDGLLWVGTLTAGLLIWSPVLGFRSANEVVAARRRHRRRVAMLAATGGDIWARQARREFAGAYGRAALRDRAPRDL